MRAAYKAAGEVVVDRADVWADSRRTMKTPIVIALALALAALFSSCEKKAVTPQPPPDSVTTRASPGLRTVDIVRAGKAYAFSVFATSTGGDSRLLLTRTDKPSGDKEMMHLKRQEADGLVAVLSKIHEWSQKCAGDKAPPFDKPLGAFSADYSPWEYHWSGYSFYVFASPLGILDADDIRDLRSLLSDLDVLFSEREKADSAAKTYADKLQ